MTPERKEEILKRSREISVRVQRTIDEYNNDPRVQARRKELMVDTAVERARVARLAREHTERVEERVEQEMDDAVKRSVERIVETTTLERAQELCELAWKKSPFERNSNTGFPNLRGNCEGKSLWLQQHLGGAVVTGWRTDNGRYVRHAALILPVAGHLYVCDGGKVIPLANYPFVFQGFYEKL